MFLKGLGKKLGIFSIGFLLITGGSQLAGCKKEGESLPDTSSVLIPKVANFAAKYHLKKQDITIVLFDGSISTDMGYASKRPDSSYRPPCTTEYNIPSFIEEKLRFSGQEYRRYDAAKDRDVKGGPAVFAETGKAVTQQFDAAWDWQNNPPQQNGYNGLTRIVTGAKPSVTYQFPPAAKRADFIYRTDYLSSAAIKVSVGGLINQAEVFDETDMTWKEAEGFVFSAREKNELIAASFYPNTYFGATSLRKTIYQKRLKMRAKGVHANLQVSITSQDGNRLCYWGIAFSPQDYMFQFINNSRGSHGINDLAVFESWSVDYWKPDLIIFSCNTINEGADVSHPNSTYSPINFADHFEMYINKFLAKPYKPDMFAYILFTARPNGLVNDQDVIGKTHIENYGDATVADYLNELDKRLQKLPIASANAFNHYVSVGYASAKMKNTKAYAEFFGDGSGPTGPGFVGDFVHLNNYGAQVGWQYLKPFFNF
ncbi:MAG: hypothetical protein ABI151_07590 [Chitinophagaceae bacterium]